MAKVAKIYTDKKSTTGIKTTTNSKADLDDLYIINPP
jgi:hypothetical protein